MIRKITAGLICVAVTQSFAGPAFAQSAFAQGAPDTQNGRYSFTPVKDGLIRLDVKTGDVSTCTASGAGWACYLAPQERTALDAEIERLRAENAKLKADLAARSAAPVVAETIRPETPKSDMSKPKVIEAAPAGPETRPETRPAPDIKSADKSAAAAPDANRDAVIVGKDPRHTTIELRLPSDAEFARVKLLFERAWQRLVEAVSRLQREINGGKA